MHLKNRPNCYQETLGSELFEACPKTVFAAIAVSFASKGGDYLDEAREKVLKEWWVLYHNGIVPQKPPLPDPGDDARIAGSFPTRSTPNEPHDGVPVYAVDFGAVKPGEENAFAANLIDIIKADLKRKGR